MALFLLSANLGWIQGQIIFTEDSLHCLPPESETDAPVRMVQGTNGYGSIGYRGPCPPPGETHRYYFRIYALDSFLALPPGSGQHDLVAAMQGHATAYGETFAMYRRP
ncbi:YbhB/YbcL family Raf kinase inhibitor-like protein [Methanofollis tationis]|uniref:YbhB/YbcL family Raf kinase inhibitor-like protein n=1 Tax=Methanofollis tationis TaxID=81417 RepID=UPI00248428FD|nr:YbhB/YbcL family Raf kinase inhibitor-like protein [Methanofollis tationis]